MLSSTSSTRRFGAGRTPAAWPPAVRRRRLARRRCLTDRFGTSREVAPAPGRAAHAAHAAHEDRGRAVGDLAYWQGVGLHSTADRRGPAALPFAMHGVAGCHAHRPPNGTPEDGWTARADRQSIATGASACGYGEVERGPGQSAGSGGASGSRRPSGSSPANRSSQTIEATETSQATTTMRSQIKRYPLSIGNRRSEHRCEVSVRPSVPMRPQTSTSAAWAGYPK